MSSDKVVPFIHFNTIVRYLSSEFSDNENEINFSELNSIFTSVDKEDIKGKIIVKKEDDMPDMMLNEKEQKNFLEQIKIRLPELYDKLNDFFNKMKNKTNNEILVDNLISLTDPWGGIIPNETNLNAALEHLNNENLTDTIVNYDLKYSYSPMFYSVLSNVELMGASKKTIKKVMDKYKSLAGHIIENCKRKNIYVADYEKQLQETLTNKDYQNYAMALDRLCSRFIIETDVDMSINASKRKLKLKEPNGKIDESFVQGYTRNCWFMSAIVSMTKNATFLERLNNMITVNKDGDKITSVTVNIQGKNYEIAYDVLKNANEYSSGDLDVRALEMAVNQYMHENNLGDCAIGNFSSTAYKCLFGEENLIINNYMDDEYNLKSSEYLDAIKKEKNFISTIGTRNFSMEENAFAVDDNGCNVILHGGHVYSVSKVDDEFLYFKDPHNMTQELRIPIKDFDKYFHVADTCKFINEKN